MASRFVTSQGLLGGICFCGLCGGAMTLRTGKNGRYRYYTCSTKARMGKAGCIGITVPMDKLDDAVVEHLERRLLQPDRLCMLMGNVLDRRQEWVERRRSHVAELRKRSAEAANKLVRLYAAVEDGLVGQGSEGLGDRIRELEAIKKEAAADAERAEAAIDKQGPMITPEAIERMALATREGLRAPDGSIGARMFAQWLSAWKCSLRPRSRSWEEGPNCFGRWPLRAAISLRFWKFAVLNRSGAQIRMLRRTMSGRWQFSGPNDRPQTVGERKSSRRPRLDARRSVRMHIARSGQPPLVIERPVKRPGAVA
jgi:hypothetical protein